MKKINLELTDLKELYDYVSEAIVIVDEKHDIVLVNKVALKKFEAIEENILYTNIAELIPIDYQEDIFKTVKDSDESYYDIFLKKFNDHSLFPAFVSGQMLQLKDITYGILNIVDITELKKQEEKKLKKLKSHIISQATTHAQKASEIKGQNTTELITLQDELDQAKHEIFKLERKLTLFERENHILNGQAEKIQENSFSFEQVLDREIALGKRYGRKFSLAIVGIDDYKTFSEQVNSEAKKELILRAFKKHFRSTIRTTDVIYYENSGLFYMILPNSNDVNITDLVKRLLHAKKIDTRIIVKFNCGIAHFYEQDTREHLLYRARKNLEENIKENSYVIKVK
ncbi:MAG: diguanylate cyclase [Arcobacteraceae bacterium]|nr:diguanylate cyclase [Arcobacteraceae bacterium]